MYETAVILDTELSNGTPPCVCMCVIMMWVCTCARSLYVLVNTVHAELPYNDYLEHYGPEYTLHITPSNMENQNSKDYLEKVKYVYVYMSPTHLQVREAVSVGGRASERFIWCSSVCVGASTI